MPGSLAPQATPLQSPADMRWCILQCVGVTTVIRGVVLLSVQIFRHTSSFQPPSHLLLQRFLLFPLLLGRSPS